MFNKKVLLLIATLLTPMSQAAWFEATGQAVIYNNNKTLARQQATQEALRQALLFAGASVRSVQQMTDGLLQDEDLEIRASGEVSQVELIREHYYEDYVEVAIRADIFPQEVQCSAGDYKKAIATTRFHFTAKQQASVGALFDLAMPLTQRINAAFAKYAKHTVISDIEPWSFFPTPQNLTYESMRLSEQLNSQYILIGDIVELSTEIPETTYIDVAKFWSNKKIGQRFIGLRIQLIDGANGDLLHDKTYQAVSPWPFDKYEQIDAYSATLWQSPFGKTIDSIFREIVIDIDDKLTCEPAFGRIIEVYQNRLSVNLGANHGMQKGDELSVFQMRHYFSTTGIPHVQYNIHPSKVVVIDTNRNSATLSVSDGTPLANIQPNDFVVKR